MEYSLLRNESRDSPSDESCQIPRDGPVRLLKEFGRLFAKVLPPRRKRESEAVYAWLKEAHAPCRACLRGGNRTCSLLAGPDCASPAYQFVPLKVSR